MPAAAANVRGASPGVSPRGERAVAQLAPARPPAATAGLECGHTRTHPRTGTRTRTRACTHAHTRTHAGSLPPRAWVRCGVVDSAPATTAHACSSSLHPFPPALAPCPLLFLPRTPAATPPTARLPGAAPPPPPGAARSAAPPAPRSDQSSPYTFLFDGRWGGGGWGRRHAKSMGMGSRCSCSGAGF